MFQATAAYNPTTRTLTLTDAATGLLALRRVARVDGPVPTPVTEPTTDTSIPVVLSDDGVYQFVLQLVDAEGTVLQESQIITHAEDGSQRLIFAQAYLKHAAKPFVRGNDAAYRQAWTRLYALQAAAAEQNPHQLRQLAKAEKKASKRPEALPALVPQPVGELGLPLPAVGVAWRVDNPAPGSVAVYTRLQDATGLSVSIAAPGSDTEVSAEGVATSDGLVFSFAAPTDGLYTVRIRFGTVPFATLTVPVLRKPFLALREQVRALGLTSADRNRRQGESHLPRLARLACAEAAARTGNADLAERLIASAAKLPEAEKPTHTYPLRRNG